MKKQETLVKILTIVLLCAAPFVIYVSCFAAMAARTDLEHGLFLAYILLAPLCTFGSLVSLIYKRNKLALYFLLVPYATVIMSIVYVVLMRIGILK